VVHLGHLLQVQVDGDQMTPENQRTKQSDVRSAVASVSQGLRGDAGNWPESQIAVARGPSLHWSGHWPRRPALVGAVGEVYWYCHQGEEPGHCTGY